MKLVWCVLLALFFASSCAETAKQLPPPTPEELRSDDPGLQPNDVVNIQVFGEKDLSGKFQVSEEGTIDYPLVGRLHVVQLTPPEVADLLSKKLQDGYLKEPNISVFVDDYGKKKRVHVWGQVQRSGTFNFSHRMTIIEAITLAGGTTPMAESTFQVTRLEEGKLNTYKVSAAQSSQYLLQPGDVVYVPERVF